MALLFGPVFGSAWWPSVGIIAATTIFVVPFYKSAQFLIRRYTEKTPSDWDDILVGIITGPLISGSIAILSYTALRIQVKLAIPANESALQKADNILLDIAYLEGEVDEARVKDAELDRVQRLRKRTSLESEIKSLRGRHPEITDAAISRIVGGAKTRQEGIFSEEDGKPGRIFQCLDEIYSLRTQYVDLLASAGGDSDANVESRLTILQGVKDQFAWFSDAAYTIGDLYRSARKDMDKLMAEIGKEPVVYSRLELTEEGRPYVAIELNVYASHLERRFEVTHKLNLEIQRRFAKANLNAA